ncbi:MAG: dTDP-4-dehydrorhamnose 3,5-epimerase family protein [Thermoanaerobaculia bacterium]
MIPDPPLPVGVTRRNLAAEPDDRGLFCEIYRAEWVTKDPAIQWNVIRSRAGVMRGVRVHLRHEDYLVLLDGSLLVGLRDLRRGSATEGMVSLLELESREIPVLTIPPGVAHGVYSPDSAQCILGVTSYYDPADELACRWDDPDLAIPWPFATAIVSPGDARGMPISEVREIVARSA